MSENALYTVGKIVARRVSPLESFPNEAQKAVTQGIKPRDSFNVDRAEMHVEFDLDYS